MKQKDMRFVIRTSPFKTFRLHLADGKSLRAPHPDFVMAGSSHVVIATENPDGAPGELNIVPYEAIVRLEHLAGRTRKAA